MAVGQKEIKVILASGSPRRKELLKNLIADFEIIPAKGREAYTEQDPEKIVQQLAMQKAAEIEQQLAMHKAAETKQQLAVHKAAETKQDFCGQAAGARQDMLIIGADTVVAFGGQILGKPEDASHAKEMLQMLAGNVHQVYTGVALILVLHGKRQCIEFADCTNVRFYPMSAQEIEAYVQSGEPMDKAGAYGIQGTGGRFVQGIEGDYQNVVGLPVAKLYQVFKKIDEIALPF
ncbi:MAG: Maf family protein [Eubacterium sp.]|nr:Maf family protein [Eubacterium sp.]